jgi:hypothetical protein
LLIAILSGIVIARSLVFAQPDQWLLCIRNGNLVRAGVGIYLWRRPGAVVTRFSSTLQRVGFAVCALSRERLRVSIDGFLLWSVAKEGDGPFRAFQKLGLANLDAPPRDLKSPKHLLSTPQHRAFQQLLGAMVQRLAATKSLEELLLQQGGLVTELRRELTPLEQEMGIRVGQIEILQVRPSDDELLRQMSAEIEERVRASAGRHQLEREKALRLAKIAQDREVQLRQHGVDREQALAAETRATEVSKSVLEREEMLFAARLDRIRREAEANRDAVSAVTSAEERKSQGVRDYELARLALEKVGDALKQLPLREARWITVGPDTPAGSLASLVTAVQEVARPGNRRA